MAHKKRIQRNFFSTCISLFLLFYLVDGLKLLFQGTFTTLDGLRLINLIVFLALTFWMPDSFKRIIRMMMYSSYMFIVGCLFAFVWSQVPFVPQTLMLYFIGAFFGGIHWELLASTYLFD